MANTANKENIPPATISAKTKVGKSRDKKRFRTAISGYQTYELETFFAKKQYVKTAEKYQLSKKLNLSEKSITTWFQNRRIRQKKNKVVQKLQDATLLNNAEIDNNCDVPMVSNSSQSQPTSETKVRPNTVPDIAVYEPTHVFSYPCQVLQESACFLTYNATTNYVEAPSTPQVDNVLEEFLKIPNVPNVTVGHYPIQFNGSIETAPISSTQVEEIFNISDSNQFWWSDEEENTQKRNQIDEILKDLLKLPTSTLEDSPAQLANNNNSTVSLETAPICSTSIQTEDARYGTDYDPTWWSDWRYAQELYQ